LIHITVTIDQIQGFVGGGAIQFQAGQGRRVEVIFKIAITKRVHRPLDGPVAGIDR